MKKEISKSQNKPPVKVDPLVTLFLKAHGVPDQKGEFGLVHSGCIKKLPPQGWEKYTLTPKKKSYINCSSPLVDTSKFMFVGHDLEDK